MRARYDLGFGHPKESAGIVGVVELKAGLSTFDGLESMSRFDKESDAEINAPLPTGQTEKLHEEPLILDLLKLLDPQLEKGAFRISWIANGRRGQSTAAEIRERAQLIVEHVARERNLSGTNFHVDAATGWLVCTWPQCGCGWSWRGTGRRAPIRRSSRQCLGHDQDRPLRCRRSTSVDQPPHSPALVRLQTRSSARSTRSTPKSKNGSTMPNSQHKNLTHSHQEL
jgi:hypothetical protein